MNISKKAVLLALLLTLSCVVLVSSPTAVGRQPDIIINLEELSPGDAVAPHLYDWYFDGVDDYIIVSSFDFNSLANGFTFAFDAKPLYSGATFLRLIYHITAPRGYFSIGYYIRGPTTGYWAFETRDTNANEYYRSGSSDVSFPAWHAVVVWWNVMQGRLYINGQLEKSVLDTRSSKEMAYTGIKIGAPYSNFYGRLAYLLIYARAVAEGEIQNIRNHLVGVSDLKLFLDATFFNGTHFIDLSGNGNHGVGYNGVQRVPAENRWFYIVKGLHSDGLVHFRFFPRYSTVYLYDGAGLLKYVFVIDGAANHAGLVEDFAVKLPPGTYTVWVFLDFAMPIPLSIVASTSKQWYGLGENVILRAECINPFTGDRIIEQVSSVNASITLPNGTRYNMTLSDDGIPPDDVGGDGVYHGVFTSADQIGTYFFEVRMLVGVFNVTGLGSFAVGSITEEIQFTMMSWHDPSLLERVVWAGTAVIAISIVFCLFALYSTMVRTGWVARHRMLVILGGWVLVFMIQLAYIATNPVVVYGVFYNVTSRGFEYSTTPNPVLTPVIGVTLSTGVVTIASFLTGYLRDQVVRMRRRYAQL